MKISQPRFLLIIVMSLLYTARALSQNDSVRVYTKEHPLIFVGERELWPYSFLNANGVVDGFSIELGKMLLDELGIPYMVYLKPSAQALSDLKEGRADMMLGLAAGYHDEFGKYSKNSVTLFTQSVVTPKGKPVEIQRFQDLSNHQVIVRDSSLCHHLMLDYGWINNATPVSDMREAILKLANDEKGQIVWNTLSLKWLLHRYNIENLELTPVVMPHGEYKFMSNDQHLLDLLDETYSRLETAEKLQPLRSKWFYPERTEKKLPEWMWYVVGGAALLILILGVYIVSYRIQNRKLKRLNTKHNSRLALIIQASQVRIWTYDIKANNFSWRSENGRIAYTYSMEEFVQRYSPEDFNRLKGVLNELAASRKDDKDDDEKEYTLQLVARDTENGSDELRDYIIALSVLDRDKSGNATVIVGTKKDITKECQQQREEEERSLRYQALFNTQLLGVMYFDKDGILADINDKACEMYGCQADNIIAERVSIYDVLDLEHLRLEDADEFRATQFINLDRLAPADYKVKGVRHTGILCNEFRLMTVNDDSGELMGIFAVCRDVTPTVKSYEREQEAVRQVNEVERILSQYATYIDRALENSDIRMARYSPMQHLLTIYAKADKVQHTLTQTRCMTLVDERSKKVAMRLLNDMDGETDKVMEADVWTTLRDRSRRQLALHFRLTPLHDEADRVTEYVGLCRDMSELRHMEQQLTVESAKVEEVEKTKNSFINNMVQEIRTPMNTIVDHVEQLSPNGQRSNEPELTKGILDNADYLIHLIDNILYLSRLEARMVEINKQPRDFAKVFESQCMAGWIRFRNANTRYVVENPYEQLVIDIDVENLGNAIAQLTANAAQHTASGVVRTRYDYIGRRLMITIDDTGEGIPPEELKRINEMDSGTTRTTKGLGLTITKELVRQMGGNVDISSEVGLGTTVYLTIPCHALVIKRKRMI